MSGRVSTSKIAHAGRQILASPGQLARQDRSIFSGANVFATLSENSIHITYDTRNLDTEEEFSLSQHRESLDKLIDWYISHLEQDLTTFRAVKRRISTVQR